MLSTLNSRGNNRFRILDILECEKRKRNEALDDNDTQLLGEEWVLDIVWTWLWVLSKLLAILRSRSARLVCRFAVADDELKCL